MSRVYVDEQSRLKLPRGVRLARDPEGRPILLAPERVLVLDDEAYAVLTKLDGAAPVADIAGAVAAEYETDTTAVIADVTELLQILADRGYVST